MGATKYDYYSGKSGDIIQPSPSSPRWLSKTSSGPLRDNVAYIGTNAVTFMGAGSQLHKHAVVPVGPLPPGDFPRVVSAFRFMAVSEPSFHPTRPIAPPFEDRMSVWTSGAEFSFKENRLSVKGYGYFHECGNFRALHAKSKETLKGFVRRSHGDEESDDGADPSGSPGGGGDDDADHLGGGSARRKSKAVSLYKEAGLKPNRFDSIPNAPEDFIGMEGIEMPGYEIRSNFPQADVMVHHRVVKELYVTQGRNVCYSIFDPRTEAKSYTSQLYLDDDSKLMKEGSLYRAGIVKMEAGLSGKASCPASMLVSTNPESYPVMFLHRHYKNDVRSVSASCLEACAWKRISSVRSPGYGALPEMGQELILYGSGGSDLAASANQADLGDLVRGGADEYTGCVLAMVEGQHWYPNLRQLALLHSDPATRAKVLCEMEKVELVRSLFDPSLYIDR